jgi:hypothetical protein
MKDEMIQALTHAVADMMPHLAARERDQKQVQVFHPCGNVRYPAHRQQRDGD